MRHLLYALLATARPSLKPQRELALQTLASRQQPNNPTLVGVRRRT
jgi:hypothetical protein